MPRFGCREISPPQLNIRQSRHLSSEHLSIASHCLRKPSLDIDYLFRQLFTGKRLESLW